MLSGDDFHRPDRRILSGAVHYFRSFPEQWPHRLAMLRAMGANAVETYVPWNRHERVRGSFDFTGMADLERFLALAAEADLAAIVRPGPYICAEWENGGLPAWLRAEDPSTPLRCSDPAYLAAVDDWFAELIPRLAGHQADRGGNVIAVQIENEYGSYGTDGDYLKHLVELLRRNGITVPLFTSDGPRPHQLTAGTVPGSLASVNFGSRPTEAFAVLRSHRPDDRLWCMEYWNGWFDHWGEPHHVRPAAEAAAVLDTMLAAGAAVNIYLAHGGTNFGTWSGANHTGTYQPTVTSYDYDAPIAESGEATAKYHAFREVAARYLTVPDRIPEPEPRLPRTTVELTEALAMRDVSAEGGSVHPMPPRFETLGLDNGLVGYRHRLRGPREPAPLILDGLADRAQLFLDGEPLATVLRDDPDTPEVTLSCGPQGAVLDILVESLGRVNFGSRVGESKGILGGVRHGEQFLHGWQVATLRLDTPPTVGWRPAAEVTDPGPRFLRGRFDVSEPGNGFVDLADRVKGYLWVNGFCLGRYWDRGPQRRLYLPWPLLRAGDNELVVCDLHPVDAATVTIETEPALG